MTGSLLRDIEINKKRFFRNYLLVNFLFARNATSAAPMHGAGINIIIVGFPTLATVDNLVQPILTVTSPVIAFFIVWGLAQSALEVVFRMMDSGVDSNKDTRAVRPTRRARTATITPTVKSALR